MSKSHAAAVVVVLLVALAVTVVAVPITADPTPTTWRAAIEAGWPWFLGTIGFMAIVYTASRLFYKESGKGQTTGINQKKGAYFGGTISKSTQEITIEGDSMQPVGQEEIAFASKIDSGGQKVGRGVSQSES